jgi:hypothetical protein
MGAKEQSLDDVAFSPDDAAMIVPLDGRDRALLDAIETRFPSLVRRSPGPFVIFEPIPQGPPADAGGRAEP